MPDLITLIPVVTVFAVIVVGGGGYGGGPTSIVPWRLYTIFSMVVNPCTIAPPLATLLSLQVAVFYG